MALVVEWTEDAIRDLRGLPADRRAQIVRRVEAWAGGMPSDVKKLAGSDAGQRVRVNADSNLAAGPPGTKE